MFFRRSIGCGSVTSHNICDSVVAKRSMNALRVHSHKAQLILVAVTASLATAALLTAHSAYTRRVRRKELNDEVVKALAAKDSANEAFGKYAADYDAHKTPGADYDEGLIKEQLARNYAFFGEEAMAKMRKGSVVIVGCGGVGSWAAVMLVRSYVHMRWLQNISPNISILYNQRCFQIQARRL